ncbi:CinA family protein [Sessilibacter corallicola]|nr:CinA family protein [Sessilibacter corallicola]
MKSMTESLSQQLGSKLADRRYTVATAESCTGGGIASAITEIPGSSLWFEMGLVTYSNTAKMQLLNVNPETLANHGAVSEETVKEMAQGALAASGANMAVAVSGVAGPTGGSKDKPIGTVWIAWSAKFTNSTRSRLFNFNGGRAEIRRQAVMASLRGLIDLLE